MHEPLVDITEQAPKLLWSYGSSGAVWSSVVATVGTIFTGLLGGWDMLIKLLLACLLSDTIFGFLAAAKEKKANSTAMMWGGLNKILVILFVVLANLFDMALALDAPYIRTALIWFYIGREGLSMIENAGRLGLWVPNFFKKILEQLQDKGDKGGSE